MKKLLKIVLGLVGVIALALAAVFYFTADMVTVADEFFKAVKSNNMDKAYAYLSDDFKAATSRDALKDFLSKSGLMGFKDASWGQRSISGSRGELTGSVNTQSGGVIPIKISFVKGESGWKIYYIEKPSAGVQDNAASQQLPSEAQMVKLVAETMHTFALAVNEKSMAKVHEFSSGIMQRQFSVQKLDEVFASFYRLDSDLRVLDNYSPAFDEKPRITENGVLVIKGHYPTKPSQVFFEFKYIYEGLGWKLVALNVEIK